MTRRRQALILVGASAYLTATCLGAIYSRHGGKWVLVGLSLMAAAGAFVYALAQAREEHIYVSTACFHEKHDDCRHVCKFCDAPCACPCHTAIVTIE